MSDPPLDDGLIWKALSAIVTAFVSVLWFFFRYFIKKIDKLSESKIGMELTSFKSKDEAREAGWTSWREDRVEHTLDNHEERLRAHTAAIARIEGRLNGGHK